MSRARAPFWEKPDPALRAALFFGPDSGLAHERAGRVTEAVLGAATDPFRLAELTAAQIRADPARLADEADAISMLGGRRVVRVRGVDDARLADVIAPLVTHVLESGKGDALIVVEAGELTPKAALRKAFEGRKDAMLVECRPDGPEEVADLMAAAVREAGRSIEPEALRLLAAELGGDRGVVRSEIDKIILYTEGIAAISMADVRACLGVQAEAESYEAAQAALDGDLPRLERALQRLAAQGVSGVALLWPLRQELTRLHLVRGVMESRGAAFDQAAAQLRPPLFEAARARMRRWTQLWSFAALGLALEQLWEAERQLKNTAFPEQAVAARLFAGVAMMAARAAARGAAR